MDKFESLLTEKGIYGKVEVDISDLPDNVHEMEIKQFCLI